MYQVLCERCWHEEAVQGEQSEMPDYECPNCGAEGVWLGPFASIDAIKRPSDSWPVLTSPLYEYAGQTDRRARPR